MNLPFLKFFPTDWQADEGVQMLSLAARGLWLEMLLIMHKAGGYLRVNDREVTVPQLARLVRCDVGECKTLLAELREAGVFSEDEGGAVFSRRIIRDIERREEAREYGKMGGSPKLKANGPDSPDPDGGLREGVKGRVKGQSSNGLREGDNTHGIVQSPESIAIKESTTVASTTTTTLDFWELGRRLLATVGEPDPTGVLEALLRKHHGKEPWAIAKLRRLETAAKPKAYYKRLRDELTVKEQGPPARAVPAQVFVIEDSPGWVAWAKTRRRSLPVTQHGRDRGWFFPTEFPQEATA